MKASAVSNRSILPYTHLTSQKMANQPIISVSSPTPSSKTNTWMKLNLKNSNSNLFSAETDGKIIRIDLDQVNVTNEVIFLFFKYCFQINF